MKQSYRPSLALQRQRYESMLAWRRMLRLRGSREVGRPQIRDNSTPFIENPRTLADVEYIIRKIEETKAAFGPLLP